MIQAADMTAVVHIGPGHVQPLWAGHPWVYAQAVARITGAPRAGDVVHVVDPKGNFLGSGFYSPKSALAVRIASRDSAEILDEAFFRKRVDSALTLRRRWVGVPSRATTGYRLINAEGDGLPGLVVDIYEDVAVVQLLTIGMHLRSHLLAQVLMQALPLRAVWRVVVSGSDKHEGFTAEPGVILGEPPQVLTFKEHGFAYTISVGDTQKTGYYFDQRDHRAHVETLCRDANVLDLYCYAGAFAHAAARGGARHVLAVDRSELALAVAQQTAAHAGHIDRITFRRQDVQQALQQLLEAQTRFDVVVVDPPKLAKSQRDMERATRAYTEINARAMRCVESGGLLITCSCSGAMRPELFVRMLGHASRRADVQANLLSLSSQAADHPTPPAFAEGRYLKCALMRIER